MNNEAIVATFIYVRCSICFVSPIIEPVLQYYDCENVTESNLSFRNAVNALRYHRQDDNYCMYYLYGLKRFVCHPIITPSITP